MMGLMATTGDTTTRGELLRAKYSKVTPDAEAIPDSPNHKKPLREEFRRSPGM